VWYQLCDEVCNKRLQGMRFNRKKKHFRIQVYCICRIYYLSCLSTWLLSLPFLKKAGSNLQYFTFICLQEYKQNNMHLFLCFSLNSFGIHALYGGVFVGFLYSMCWYFSDISPDTPFYKKHEDGRNNRVFVIVVIGNFTSRAAFAPGPRVDLQHSVLDVAIFICSLCF